MATLRIVTSKKMGISRFLPQGYLPLPPGYLRLHRPLPNKKLPSDYTKKVYRLGKLSGSKT